MLKAPTFRHELKHFISWSDYYSLRSRLLVVSQRDPHTDSDGQYRIRSLYFDNADNKALREKLDGVRCREKFRIRYYNSDYHFIHLEKKSKISGLGYKESAPLTKEECERMLAGDTAWMQEHPQALVRELSLKMRTQQLRPRTLVDYIREPYIYRQGNVRVTFDFNVRSGLYSCGLFDENLPTMPAGRPSSLLLEVKYDAFLPSLIADILQTNSRQSSAFSKYAACRLYG